MGESIQFVWSYAGRQIHILLNDEDELGMTLCGSGHAYEMDKSAPGTNIPDSDVMCLDCLRGAANLADVWQRKFRKEEKST